MRIAVGVAVAFVAFGIAGGVWTLRAGVRATVPAELAVLSGMELQLEAEGVREAAPEAEVVVGDPVGGVGHPRSRNLRRPASRL